MTTGDVAIDRLITQPWPYGTAPLVFYVRPAGNDANNGTSALTAFATLGRALREMNLYSVNQPVIIDVTGMTGASAISGDEVLNLGGTNLGGISFDLDLTATAPNNFFSRRHRQIRSELSLVQALTVTGSAFNATTGLLTLTVSDALVANALRGLFAVGSVLGEYGCIKSNSGGAGPNTIEVANIVGLTNPVGAYAPGATLTFGDAANFFEQAIYLEAMCDWTLQGLTISSNGPKDVALSIWPNAAVDVVLCDLLGVEINAGGGHVTLDACYVHGELFSHDGATLTVTQSFFRDMSFLCHGSGGSGLNEWIGNMIQLAGSFGGGNLESNYSFEMQSCQVEDGVDEGIHILFGTSRVRDVRVLNCLKSGIKVDGQVTAVLDNVQGSGNTGYGVEATHGAAVQPLVTTAVTGTTNDVFLGDLGAITWAAIAASPGGAVTDLGQLVRVGP